MEDNCDSDIRVVDWMFDLICQNDIVGRMGPIELEKQCECNIEKSRFWDEQTPW